MTALTQTKPATKVLPTDLDALEAIADWRDDLFARIRRAQLRFELIGLDGEEIDALAAEATAFKRCCRGLTWGLE
jgi:hypothetical protein